MRKLFFMLLMAALTTLSSQALSVTNTAGRLAQAVDDELGITTLTVSGTMDARDFLFITNSLNDLTTLDLSEVTIVPYSKGAALYGTVTSYQGNEIPRTAFFGKKLTQVTLPRDLESIGFAAFAGCYQLTSITLPATVAFIDDYAFAGTALTSVEVPASVQVMGKGVFSRCEALTSAVVNGRTVGDFAFLGDYQLASVNVGAGVNMIGRGAFNGCTALTTLTIDPACRMSRIDEEAFINSGLQNIDVKSLGVGTIGDWAFAQTKLSSLHLSDATTTLGEGALAHNPLLETVILPGLSQRPSGNGRGGDDDDNPRFNAAGPRHTLDHISDYTFAGDGQLQPGSMLKEGVASIGNYAFYNVSADIDTMRLPSSIAYLGDRAMAGMTGMQVLKTGAADVPALGEDVWAGVDQASVPLITPSEASTERYKGADQWMNFFFAESGFLLGDVNRDGSVTISDVTSLIDYLLGGGDIDVRAADINQDGSVTISDVTALIDQLLSGSSNSSLMRLRLLGKSLPTTSDVLTLPIVSMRAGDTRTIDVNLNNDEHDYVALQCEVVLPEGLKLVGVNGIDRGMNHDYYSRANVVENNVYTIMGVSFDMAKYAGSEGNVMSLTVTATEDYGSREAEVLLANVLLVTPDHKTYLASDATGMINDNNMTGVEQLTADKEVAAIRYINVAGQESDTPFDGMNIVVTTYTDGTVSTVKVMK